ncbi:dephospho-CoA kinase [Cumulibacter soli]|uniref:dephospho-CoA kinase n=1 Tax=Cumulibacter soli TaxID=2546344 RepID=UPI0014196357|nr:dephospho-CoA kinase [Cumulibacter soli]
MLTLGLTGGIGSGKSAASTVLNELGATIVDADKIAREVVEPGTDGLRRVAEAFGDQVLDSDGSLNRPALAQIVFNDEQARQTLNGIVHPLVRGRSEQIVAAAGDDAIVVHDIPLLAEGTMAPSFHLVLIVATPQEVRLERLSTHRGMDRADALARIKAQATEEQRLAIADVVLDNAGSPQELREQIEQVYADRLTPYADALAAGRSAASRVNARDGAVAREYARLAWALGQLDTTVEQHTGGDAPAIVRGATAEIRSALNRAGWFGDAELAPADPGGVLRVNIVDEPR